MVMDETRDTEEVQNLLLDGTAGGYGEDAFPIWEEYPDCEICGEPIDYCSGHGTY